MLQQSGMNVEILPGFPININELKVALHVRVNFRELYREHLGMTFRRESKFWLAGSLRSLLRALELRELSEYEVYVYT